MANISNPHDRFFKEVFSRSETVRELLRLYLPEPIAASLDLDSLALQSDSFIDPDLQEHFSDLIYQAQLLTGETAYVYILLEHKSYPDPLVVFQLLRYVVRIWERALRNARRSDRLAPVIPVVIYHGRTPWRAAQNLSDLFLGPEILRAYWPEFRYWLIDLSAYDDADIKGAVTLQTALLLMKYIMQPDLAARLPGIFMLLRELTEQDTGLEYLYTLLRYVSQAADEIDQETLGEAIHSAFPVRGGEMMKTLAKEWMEEGIQQGIQQGRQEGFQEGIRQGLLASIELGLELRFDAEGLRLLPEIYKIDDADVLRAIHEGLKRVQTLEELQHIYR